MKFAAAAAMVLVACTSSAHAGTPAGASYAVPCDAPYSSFIGYGFGSSQACLDLVAQIQGLDEVTVEFSDRYQPVTVPVQVYTRSWVTHVDFVLPDGRLLGATPLGVRIRPWTPAIHSVRYTFKADAEKVLGFALSQVGKPYDYVGLSGYALRIGFLHQKRSWFCSDLVQAAALAGGVDLSGRSPKFTSPARIKDSPLLTRTTRERSYLAGRPEQLAQTPAQAAGG